jgi:D-alanine-D-alanine ligase
MAESRKKRFKRVVVLKGGPSSEREVSLRSGAAVARGLRDAGYEVIEVDVRDRTVDLPKTVEAVFIALHGEFGEDGQVQSLLEQRGLPYTGSGPLASRISFDKRLSKAVFIQAGIPTASYEILGPDQARTLALPVVVKPPCQGSTIGVFRVFEEKDWMPAFREALQYDGEVLVEDFIPGRELTVGIVGETVLPPIEILAPDGWYDYDAKYSKGQSRHLCPAPLDSVTATRCQTIALETFRALKCRGLGRTDFRLMDDGALYVLELNNIPGFTETSLLPEAAQAAGIGFSSLCEQIMEMAGLSNGER